MELCNFALCKFDLWQYLIDMIIITVNFIITVMFSFVVVISDSVSVLFVSHSFTFS